HGDRHGVGRGAVHEDASLVALLALRDALQIRGERVDEVVRLDGQRAALDDLPLDLLQLDLIHGRPGALTQYRRPLGRASSQRADPFAGSALRPRFAQRWLASRLGADWGGNPSHASRAARHRPPSTWEPQAAESPGGSAAGRFSLERQPACRARRAGAARPTSLAPSRRGRDFEGRRWTPVTFAKA